MTKEFMMSFPACPRRLWLILLLFVSPLILHAAPELDIPALINVVKTLSSEGDRMGALNTLSQSKDPRVYDLLIATLNDPDMAMRGCACIDLGIYGDPRADDTLVKEMNADDSIETAFAAQALSRLHDSRLLPVLISRLQKNPPDRDETYTRQIFREIITGLGAAAAEPLAKAMGGRQQAFFRVWAVEMLLALGDAATAQVAAALQSPDPGERLGAAMVLARHKDARAVDPLLEAMRTTDPLLRQSAIIALGWTGDQRAVAPLVECYAEKNDGFTPLVTRALGENGSRQAADALLLVLHDPRVNRDNAVTLALLRIPLPAAVTGALQQLKEKDANSLHYYAGRLLLATADEKMIRRSSAGC